jgi:hypothetical protein
MKKISKEEWKEILEDEPYSNYSSFDKRKSKKRKCLEEAINFVRFELLYPKMKEEYNSKDGYEKFPKGAGSAVIVNMIAGAYIFGREGLIEGAIIGGACASIQLTLGFGTRSLTKYILEKYKKFNEKRKNS